MSIRVKIAILIVIAALVSAAGQAWAQGIKERMHDRLPQINDLKARGIVGENNQGFLEFMKGKSEKAEVVAAENADRREVYEAIAKQTGTTAQVVGQRRALQIAEIARPGEWLQGPDGKWHQK